MNIVKAKTPPPQWETGTLLFNLLTNRDAVNRANSSRPVCYTHILTVTWGNVKYKFKPEGGAAHV